MKHPLDLRLKLRLRLFCLIWIALVGLIGNSLIHHEIPLLLAVSGILVGILPGLSLSRMHRLRWDEKAEKLVGQLDWTGAGILVLYLLFLTRRAWFFGHWVHSDKLATFLLCVSAGTMTGRVLGIRRGFRRIMTALDLSAK